MIYEEQNKIQPKIQLRGNNLMIVIPSLNLSF